MLLTPRPEFASQINGDLYNSVFTKRVGHMNNHFLVSAISKNVFADLFVMSDEELSSINMKWVEVENSPCYPCRVSLQDAEVGEKVLALSFIHHDVETPYKASGPIFVREFADTVAPSVGEIPEMLRHRLLSVRAYNSANYMIDAETVCGSDVEVAIDKQFDNKSVAYIHLHNAKQGCFNCVVNRAS